MANTDFIRERISALRVKKGVSEYQMGRDLGHSRSYMNNISSGKSIPPMRVFLDICDYFGITPCQFFDVSVDNPEIYQTAVDELKKLDEDDIRLTINIIRRFNKYGAVKAEEAGKVEEVEKIKEDEVVGEEKDVNELD